jgi:hypothetical protein
MVKRHLLQDGGIPSLLTRNNNVRVGKDRVGFDDAFYEVAICEEIAHFAEGYGFRAVGVEGAWSIGHEAVVA